MYKQSATVTTDLVTEGLDLTEAPVNQLTPSGTLLISIDLNVQGNPLDALLVAEVRAETMDGHVNLRILQVA